MIDPPSESCSSPIIERTWPEPASIGYQTDTSNKSKKTKIVKKQKFICDDAEDIALWSPAKRNAWMARDKNPNAFYYRHVSPGQIKKTGAWDAHEKELFMRAIELHPPNQGKWGIFAEHIPGRVGYQCRNFYHRLLETGELKEIPGTEEKPIVHRKRKQSVKAVPKIEQEIKMVLESDSEELTEEEVNVPEVLPPEEYLINSLTLYSSSLRISASEFVYRNQEVVKPPEPVKLQEVIIPQELIQPPEPIKDVEFNKPVEIVTSLVQIPEPVKQVEFVKPSEPVKPLDFLETVSWNPKMDSPWRRLSALGEAPRHVVFPDASQIQRGSYQCSKILKRNLTNPLNLVLLSLQVPDEKQNSYVRIVKEMLASDIDQMTIDRLVREYFQIQNECLECLTIQQKMVITSAFADKVMEVWK